MVLNRALCEWIPKSTNKTNTRPLTISDLGDTRVWTEAAFIKPRWSDGLMHSHFSPLRTPRSCNEEARRCGGRHITDSAGQSRRRFAVKLFVSEIAQDYCAPNHSSTVSSSTTSAIHHDNPAHARARSLITCGSGMGGTSNVT